MKNQSRQEVVLVNKLELCWTILEGLAQQANDEDDANLNDKYEQLKDDLREVIDELIN